MRNDLILLEFSNSDEREVLLDPAKVVALANSLEHCARALAPFVVDSIDGGTTAGEWKCYIAGADRGSVRLLFRLIFNPTEQDRQLIDHLNKVADLVEKVAKSIGWAAIALGVVTVVNDKPISPSAEATIGQKASKDPEVIKLVEEFSRRALAAGPDNAKISFDGVPELAFTAAGMVNPDLIGDRATDGPLISPNFFGPVTLTGEKIEVNPMHMRDSDAPMNELLSHRTPLYVGKVTSQGLSRYVLVSWGSKRELPAPNVPVSVRGDLNDLSFMNTVKLLSEVPAGARSVSGVLHVSTMVVEE